MIGLCQHVDVSHTVDPGKLRFPAFKRVLECQHRTSRSQDIAQNDNYMMGEGPGSEPKIYKEGGGLVKKYVSRVASCQFDLNSTIPPRILGAFSLTFPDLTAWIWPVSHEIPSVARKKLGTQTIWFFSKICLEIKEKIWCTQVRSFSLTFPDSRQKILKFPDFPEGKRFPWFSLTLATLVRGCIVPRYASRCLV